MPFDACEVCLFWKSATLVGIEEAVVILGEVRLNKTLSLRSSGVEPSFSSAFCRQVLDSVTTAADDAGGGDDGDGIVASFAKKSRFMTVEPFKKDICEVDSDGNNDDNNGW